MLTVNLAFDRILWIVWKEMLKNVFGWSVLSRNNFTKNCQLRGKITTIFEVSVGLLNTNCVEQKQSVLGENCFPS